MRHAGFSWKSNILRGVARNLVLWSTSRGHTGMEGAWGHRWCGLRAPLSMVQQKLPWLYLVLLFQQVLGSFLTSVTHTAWTSLLPAARSLRHSVNGNSARQEPSLTDFLNTVSILGHFTNISHSSWKAPCYLQHAVDQALIPHLIQPCKDTFWFKLIMKYRAHIWTLV